MKPNQETEEREVPQRGVAEFGFGSKEDYEIRE